MKYCQKKSNKIYVYSLNMYYKLIKEFNVKESDIIILKIKLT